MDRRNWENTLINLQAFARGYLVRTEVRRAREDFEDIVQEIDGGLSHLQWRETVISIPHFTDTHGPFLRVSSSTRSPSDPGLHVSATPQNSSAGTDTCLPQERERDQCVLLEKMEAERDESQTNDQGCDPRAWRSNKNDGERQRGMREQQGNNDDEAMESIAGSTSVWSSLNLDMNCSHSQKGSQQFCLVQDVPQTSQALRAHRNSLTMELVWLQQAIDSRKKYLSLRDRLSIT